jgi:mannan endo-1,4-beta-mannosidase
MRSSPKRSRSGAPGEDLPADAFYSDPRAIAHQQAFLATLLSRTNSRTGRTYSDDPTIFAWELVNEARCTDSTHCTDATLTEWAASMAATIRGAGATQAIAWGGQGFFGSYGEDLEAIARLDDIDILTVHLYPDHFGAQTYDPGAGLDRIAAAVHYGAAWIRDAAAIAREHDKALLIEEAGWRTESGARDVERAIVLGGWARAARELDAGYLPWMIAERDRPDYDGYLIRPEREPRTAAVLRCE